MATHITMFVKGLAKKPDAVFQLNEEGSPSSPLAIKTWRSGESCTLLCRQLLSRRDVSAQSEHQHACT